MCPGLPSPAYLQLGQIYQDQGPTTSEQLIRYKTPDVEGDILSDISIQMEFTSCDDDNEDCNYFLIINR